MSEENIENLTEIEVQILEDKKVFAIALLHNPADSFKAAVKVFGADAGRALQIYNVWPVDVDVMRFQAEYIQEHGADKTLPTKENFARTVFDIANDKGNDLETRLKYFKLFGDIEGYIQKPGITNNITNATQINNKVMVMKDHGSDDEWARKLNEQQQKLTRDSA